MTRGITKSGAIFRVGRSGDGAALGLPGVRPMNFTAKTMAGFGECDAGVLADDATRHALARPAIALNKTRPPK